MIVVKLFLAQNTSRNNTYSWFKKEITEDEAANREHRARASPICLAEALSSRVVMIMIDRNEQGLQCINTLDGECFE